MNYYNEWDKGAAEWLRELIKQKLIPEGIVDERSIRDVQPGDLREFTQCHFFAGIGGWSYALQIAGWPSDRPVWTGSCPCQPFSVAGKRKGNSDERHLWPELFRLIGQCHPSVVFGEQVASPDGRKWLAGVRDDLETLGYGVGAADLCAAGVTAPHIRQRLYWVADSEGDELPRSRHSRSRGSGFTDCQSVIGLGDSDSAGRHEGRQAASGARHRDTVKSDGSWSDFDICHFTDGKTRRIEAGTFPLAPRLPAEMVPSGDCSIKEAQDSAEFRIARLRGYGNSIVPQVAEQFIRAYQEVKNSC